MAALSRL